MSGAPVSTSEQREIFKGILQRLRHRCFDMICVERRVRPWCRRFATVRDVGPSGDFIRANAVSTTSSTMAVGSTFKKVACFASICAISC